MNTDLKAVGPAVNGWNAEYLEDQYVRFKADARSISPDLVPFFQGFDLALTSGAAGRAAGAAGSGATAASGDVREAIRLHAGASALIRAYRTLGHLAAKLDPFGRERPRPGELSLGAHGLSDADLEKTIDTSDGPTKGPSTLRTLVATLEKIYCGATAWQVMHITDVEQRQWLLAAIENPAGVLTLSRADKLAIFDSLTRSESLERFCQKRYQGTKRFSLEGGEALIPLLDRLLITGADTGVEEVVIGMAHRGRVNVLNNVMGKSYEQIFTEFEDNFTPSFADGGGDVKYHRGYSSERTLASGKSIHLALASNPSHLESVDAVVEGRCRAKQRLRNDKARARVAPVLIHGDAAVIGQGVVFEVMNFSQLEGYTTGGTVHVVTNNLVGFTTGPEDARSSPYCTDGALMIEAPVFHVNGEDPEAVVAAAHLAMLYRQQFKRDVFVDVYCYRKYGHNEQDEPGFTQPVMAEQIKKMPGVCTTYAQRLVAQGVVTQEEFDAHRAKLDATLDAAQQFAKNNPLDPTIDPAGKRWKGMGYDYSHEPVKTGVSRAALEEVCAALGRVPEGFEAHPKLKKLLADRAALPTSGAITHAEGELLAIGTLLLEGTAVRLSGQDARRGTFTQRHAVLRDVRTAEPYTPLNTMRPIAESPDDAGKPGADGRITQARFCVYDSPLSEFSVMGFDYGYSLADPNMLVMWEGQFGDFVNGAQVLIDQYLASAEIKWDRWSGLTLLLPHGYEGAGPEHSSCRIERFLQLCGNDNMQVVYPTTGAQMFHLLRRQVRRNFRKPLVVATPKGFLRVPTSTFEELISGRFVEVMDDPLFAGGEGAPDRKAVSRVILCCGKIYHEMAARRALLKRHDTAIVRIEQPYPFNAKLFREVLARYPAKAELIWVQEEPRNAGVFLFIDDLLRNEVQLGRSLRYLGRPTNATPAVGSKHAHEEQQEGILVAAIGKAPAKVEAAAPANGAAGANGAGASKAPGANGTNGAAKVAAKR